MKKICGLLLIAIVLTGCKAGNKVESGKTDFSVLLNDGSAFVYTVKDSETGVWYICTQHGITPRLNSDGTLYIK